MIEEIAETVDAATDPALKGEDVSATTSGDGSFLSNGDATVKIPKTSSDLVTATGVTGAGTTHTIGVGLGGASTVQGKLASAGSVVYNAQSGSDMTVQPTVDGFRIHTVIYESAAATDFVHTVGLPAGTRLVLGKDVPVSAEESEDAQRAGEDGAFVLDAQDNVVGGFGSPWAKDANGVAVPTRFEIQGTSLVQVVDHRAAGVAYPVVADPYLGISLIKSAAWFFHSGSGWTLNVTPTWWARAQAGSYLVGAYGWKELYSKYKDRGLNTNLDGMRDQYICHQQIVAIRQPNKATWNLDEWRPNVSYLQTVNASCNPGGSVWFD